MSWSEVRETYGRELVNLRNEGRYTFLNTLFSVSEAVLYMQVGPSAAGLMKQFVLQATQPRSDGAHRATAGLALPLLNVSSGLSLGSLCF